MKKDAPKIQPQKKGASMYAVILWIILIVYVASFLIPSGSFQREGRMVIPNTYEAMEKIYLSPVDVIMGLGDSILKTFGALIITIMIVGGMMGVVNSTGVIDQFLSNVIKKLKDKSFLLIPAVIFTMGFFGALGSMISTAILFIPLGLSIAKQLKCNRVFGVALIVMGSYTGFMSSPINMLTTAMAQEIAGIPVYSGAAYRTIITIINLTLVSLFLIWYAKRITKSGEGEKDFEVELDLTSAKTAENDEKMTWRQIAVLLTFAGSFILFAVGAPLFHLGTLALGSIMFPVAFLCGIFAGYDLDTIMKHFVNGTKGMMPVIVLMMLTCVINVILDGTMIMDTIVYGLSIPLSMVGSTLSAMGMFIATTIINIFIGSGSAKTALLMPILAPLSDVVGVTRQMSVLAMQFGDGFTNLLTPINATLIGGLAMAKLNFKDWYKMVWPLFVILFVVLTVFIVLGVAMGF